jgi:hypothetical protein
MYAYKSWRIHKSVSINHNATQQQTAASIFYNFINGRTRPTRQQIKPKQTEKMRFKWPIMLIAVLLIMIANCRNANGQEEEDGEPKTTLPTPETSTTPENSTTPETTPPTPTTGPEKDKHYGLGGHTYDGKIMKLAAGSDVLNHKSPDEELKSLKNYPNTGRGEFAGKGCSVSIEGEYL